MKMLWELKPLPHFMEMATRREGIWSPRKGDMVVVAQLVVARNEYEARVIAQTRAGNENPSHMSVWISPAMTTCQQLS